MINKLLLFITILATCATVRGQGACATCPLDFTDLTASCVTATTGRTSNPFISTGIVTGRHTLITSPGTDPNTGGALQLLPAGESRVVKLGNDRVGAEAEAITYHFTVDKDHPVLLLKFAVVFEDPNHTHSAQPRFVVRITDAEGNLIEDCAEYDVSAGADISGFNTYNVNSYRLIRWRDWTNVGLDMSRFIGQDVKVQFITYDCDWSGHFGYAYFTASCISNRLQLEENSCSLTDYTVEAPDNFAAYLWDNGDQTPTTTRPASELNKQLHCILTSATGCQFTLYAYVTGNAPAVGSVFRDTICEGESYHKHNFDLPPQAETGERRYYNTYLNPHPDECSGNVTDELILEILPRYNRIQASICAGEDYTENGFTVLQPAVGVRYDTLIVQSAGNRCDVYYCLQLTVNQSLDMPNIIEGEISPCTEELVTYSFAGSETMTRYEWELPDNAVVVRGRYSSQVSLYFTDNTPADIILKGENGCGTGAVPLQINPNQTYYPFFNESACVGSDFDRHDFRLGVQDSIGYFVYQKDLHTVAGCDSVISLAINILPLPQVTITPEDNLLCNLGDDITLFAVDTAILSDLTPLDSNEMFIFDCEIEYEWNTGDVGASLTTAPLITTTYIVTATTSSGCWATASQTVVVSTLAPQTLSAEICEGEIFSDFGFNVGTSGTHTRTILQDGCNVDLVLNLTVHDTTHTLIQDVACYGIPYQDHGLNLTLYQEGLHEETFRYLRSTTGCDSIVTVEILVNPNPTTTIRDTVCQNAPYNGHGFSLPAQTIAGEFTHSRQVTTALGCDSTIVLYLQVNPVLATIISDEDCIGNRYQKHGFDIPLTTAGEMTQTRYLHSVVTGCDSVVTVNITVWESGLDTVYLESCDSVYYRGEWYHASVDTTLKLGACNFSETAIITVNHSYFERQDFYGIDSVVYQSTAYYRDTVLIFTNQTAGGCDSVLEVHISFCQRTNGSLNLEACEQITYNGITFFNDTIFTDTLVNAAGCDSLLTVNLTVHQSYFEQQNLSGYDSLEFMSKYYYRDTVLTHAYQTAQG
ncbi:MAG: hypothetical protein FWG79_03875, partial [Bacteroidales bacterium]|nr:hypothetical protein [Bacteroidales bacterium]